MTIKRQYILPKTKCFIGKQNTLTLGDIIILFGGTLKKVESILLANYVRKSCQGGDLLKVL